VGINAYDYVKEAGVFTAFSGFVAELTKTSEKQRIANTQGHHTLHNRPLISDTTHEEYKKNPKAGHTKTHFSGSIWDDHKYTGHKWGMMIDTNVCTGCSACVTACQSENNIVTVGKEKVLKGREMHWLRIDRYYSEAPGTTHAEENPETLYQPMPCQHCDNAPCESVCPVIATSHSDEGLNEMTYNRCVGTRYCANNCPYKVRRFNWFAYDTFKKPIEMVLNPEVTVRSRGVMEKCSFCVQRIKVVKNTAKDEDRELVDGEMKTACEQSCPANAITFGDVNDANSKVSKLIKEKRTYTILDELNVKPAVRYMTKVRNRKPKEHTGGGHH